MDTILATWYNNSGTVKEKLSFLKRTTNATKSKKALQNRAFSDLNKNKK